MKILIIDDEYTIRHGIATVIRNIMNVGQLSEKHLMFHKHSVLSDRKDLM